jgi:RNA-directed DNA polymerase
VVSPVLANIYLHYVLDLWFERRFKKSCRGKAYGVRYCDDFIACFQHEDEARRFRAELAERLAAFDLEVEPSKTAVLRFGTEAEQNCHREGLRRPPTFNFLGLTHLRQPQSSRALRDRPDDRTAALHGQAQAVE